LTDSEPEKFGQARKIKGLLNAAAEELPEVPLHYTLDGMKNTLHLSSMSMYDVKSALLHAGHKVSGSHTNPGALKTTAPNGVLWDVMRAWAKKYPLSEKRMKDPNSVAAKIVTKPSTSLTEVNFERHAVFDAPKVTRFHQNPPNWGPGTRAGRGQGKDEDKVTQDSSVQVESSGVMKEEEMEEAKGEESAKKRKMAE